MLSQGFAFHLFHMTDTQRRHIAFFQAYLRCKFSEPDWDASLRVTAYERTHLQHAGYVKTRFFVLPHTSPKVERADPRHRCGIVKHDRARRVAFCIRRTDGTPRPFYARLWSRVGVHISSTPPDRYESGLMSNPNQYSVNSSLVPH